MTQHRTLAVGFGCTMAAVVVLLSGCSSDGPAADQIIDSAGSPTASTTASANPTGTDRVAEFVDLANVRWDNLKPKVQDVVCFGWTHDTPGVSREDIAKIVLPPLGNMSTGESLRVAEIVLADKCPAPSPSPTTSDADVWYITAVQGIVDDWRKNSPERLIALCTEWQIDSSTWHSFIAHLAKTLKKGEAPFPITEEQVAAVWTQVLTAECG